jgi:hypothetical protein
MAKTHSQWDGMMESADSTGTLFCTLIDRRSSVPLSDARVTFVVGGGIVQVDTDSRGEFTAIFPEGVYELIVSSRGELSLTLRGIGVLAGYTQHMMRALVPGGETLEGEPSSAMGGYLVDRLGKPLPDAAVTAVAVDVGQTYTGRSDKFGAYVIHGMQPGTYDVSIRNTQRTLSYERITIAAERQFYRYDQRLLVS